MSEVQTCPSSSADQQRLLELRKLVLKLRWIGLQEEAQRLQLAVSTAYRSARPRLRGKTGSEC